MVYKIPILSQKVVQRFLSVDPLTRSYPHLSPFAFAENNPIANVDIDGLEGSSAVQKVYTQNYGPIIVQPAVDNLRVTSHPGYQPQIVKQYVRPVTAVFEVPSQEKLNNAIAKNSAEFLKIALADPQKLMAGDKLEILGVVPFAKFFKGLKLISKAFKYSDEVAELVQETGKITETSKETITLLKEGKRTFGNARKVVDDVLGDLGDDATDYISNFEKGPFNGKVVGKQSADGKRYWRIDWDPEKGAHINWVNGKTKGAILIDVDLEQAKRIVENQIIN
ncbi:MAG: hypothetical protein IPQ10_09840 [Saprospiraceae bacterium]|nr:hypothetical protein [Saprospiraceae bacterium]